MGNKTNKTKSLWLNNKIYQVKFIRMVTQFVDKDNIWIHWMRVNLHITQELVTRENIKQWMFVFKLNFTKENSTLILLFPWKCTEKRLYLKNCLIKTLKHMQTTQILSIDIDLKKPIFIKFIISTESNKEQNKWKIPSNNIKTAWYVDTWTMYQN